LRGAQRRGNPDAFIQQRLWPNAFVNPLDRRAMLAMTTTPSRHCEERSDAAIQPINHPAQPPSDFSCPYLTSEMSKY